MGERGRAPQPAKLRMLHGENRPSAINLNEPEPRQQLPTCPEEASDAVREVWDYTVGELQHMGILSTADRDALYVYCDAVVTHRRATQVINQSGLLIRSSKGAMMRNPMIPVQRDAATTIKGYAQHFGLTPSGRTGISLASTEARRESVEDNPFAGRTG